MTSRAPGFAAEAGAAAHVIVAALDDDLTVAGPEAHHLARVRRLGVGTLISAGDGTGRWRPYVIAAVTAGEIRLRAEDVGRVEPEPRCRLGLAFAPPKGDRPERVARHATELGVDRIHLLVTERTVVRWDDDRVDRALERLERVVRAAAEQSFRSRLPEIGPPLGVGELARSAGLLVADRGGSRRPRLPDGGEWLVAVGPEGGFGPSEVDQLGAAPRLCLGDLVLRAETAALAACAVLATLRDDPHL